MAFIVILAILAILIVIIAVFIVKTEDVRTSMLLRFSIVYITMLGLAVMICAQVIKLQTREYDKLTRLQRKEQTVPDTIKARRGNILSDDGRLMASSMPTYFLNMDMRVEAFKVIDKKNGKTFFENNVDSLAMALSNKFKDKSAAEYSKELRTAYRQKKSEHRLVKKTVKYTDYLEIKQFPILRRGQIQGGFTTEERMIRVNPFGILAKRTIGDIYGIMEKGGKSGLEKYYDKELKGESGLKITEKMAGKRTDIILKP
ncbi:MAG: hypothetical protein II056_05725, partial [Paludibacteraceae bacterium]|nr:hypothetical protein [Paludibacteraceae bacterium]